MRISNKNRKVLIIGTGNPGTTLAYWLSRYGYDPFGDTAQATQQAIRMAEYCVSCGQKAQGHASLEVSARRRTGWHAPEDAPRFPGKLA